MKQQRMGCDGRKPLRWLQDLFLTSDKNLFTEYMVENSWGTNSSHSSLP